MLASMVVEVIDSKLGLDVKESTCLPSKTADTRSQYSDSSCSVKSMTWMKVGSRRPNWSCCMVKDSSINLDMSNGDLIMGIIY